jgi:hypothetical protein
MRQGHLLAPRGFQNRFLKVFSLIYGGKPALAAIILISIFAHAQQLIQHQTRRT